MPEEIRALSWADVEQQVGEISPLLDNQRVFGVPRGGAVLAALASKVVPTMALVARPQEAEIILDDIIDSGATRDKFLNLYPDTRFIALIDKTAGQRDGWVHFPWEPEPQQDMEDHVRRIIEAIGDDPTREDLLETPKRVVQSWTELYSGYHAQPKLKWFENEYSETVIMRRVGFWSMCEHHMLPFWGNVDLAYVPNGFIIGISKLSRLVEVYSRRLQVQERLTTDIGTALEGPKVKGVAVSVRAQHACMIARGVRQREAKLTTNYFSGVFANDSKYRMEFLEGAH